MSYKDPPRATLLAAARHCLLCTQPQAPTRVTATRLAPAQSGPWEEKTPESHKTICAPHSCFQQSPSRLLAAAQGAQTKARHSIIRPGLQAGTQTTLHTHDGLHGGTAEVHCLHRTAAQQTPRQERIEFSSSDKSAKGAVKGHIGCATRLSLRTASLSPQQPQRLGLRDCTTPYEQQGQSLKQQQQTCWVAKCRSTAHLSTPARANIYLRLNCGFLLKNMRRTLEPMPMTLLLGTLSAKTHRPELHESFASKQP